MAARENAPAVRFTGTLISPETSRRAQGVVASGSKGRVGAGSAPAGAVFGPQTAAAKAGTGRDATANSIGGPGRSRQLELPRVSVGRIELTGKPPKPKEDAGGQGHSTNLTADPKEMEISGTPLIESKASP